MRTITVPDDISVKPPPYLPDEKPEIMTFQKYAHNVWLNDVRAIEGSFTKQCRWAKVVEKFSSIKPGDKIELEDEDYKTLLAIAEKPNASYPALVSVQLLAFPQAVLQAA